MAVQRRSNVFVAIRHTRASDVRLGVFDTPSLAHACAENAADAAARDYGYGVASVFKATLTLKGEPLRRKESR